MNSPDHKQPLKLAEISELAEDLRQALGRPLTAEEHKFFILAEQAYEAEEQSRSLPRHPGKAA